MKPLHLMGAFALTLCLAAPASAHIVFENGLAPSGSYYKGVLRVPHGCDGAATTAISVTIPEGVIGIKPMLKPGWKITTTKGAYAKTYKMHGKPVSEGVKQVTWSGGSVPDEYFDEFSFLAKLPEDPEIMMIYFPVTQYCGKTEVKWNEIAPPGADSHDLKNPAPMLMLGAPGEDHHH